MTRLILYFPISALVTLFANILQNPLDARARSDIKLMNLVVNFLSMLSTDESNGSVKRMLSVCAEFERIAKLVLDRAEKESQAKRKRKSAGEASSASSGTTNFNNAQNSQQQGTRIPTTPLANLPFTPGFNGQGNNQQQARGSGTFQPSTTSNAPTFTASTGPDGMGQTQPKLNHAFNQDFSDILSTEAMGQSPGFTAPGTAFSNPEATAPIDMSAFQQPFVPQDLWQMPMTLEWDWAEMANGFGFGNGENGQH